MAVNVEIIKLKIKKTGKLRKCEHKICIRKWNSDEKFKVSTK